MRRLEDGSTSLDEALALWERGEQLHALCRARLDAAEERVAELLDRLGRAPGAGQQPLSRLRSPVSPTGVSLHHLDVATRLAPSGPRPQ